MARSKKTRTATALRLLCVAASGLLACSALSGCLVAGYTSNGGGFIWPGGLGFIFMLLALLWFLLRRR